MLGIEVTQPCNPCNTAAFELGRGVSALVRTTVPSPCTIIDRERCRVAVYVASGQIIPYNVLAVSNLRSQTVLADSADKNERNIKIAAKMAQI